MTPQEPDRRLRRTVDANPEFAEVAPQVVSAFLSTGQLVDLRDRAAESVDLDFALRGLRRFRKEEQGEALLAPEANDIWLRPHRPAPPGFWPHHGISGQHIAERSG